MNANALKKLLKRQLIKPLIKSQSKRILKPKKLVKLKPVPKFVPKPMKSVKQMVQEYEDDIIPPPPEFRDENKMVVIQC